MRGLWLVLLSSIFGLAVSAEPTPGVPPELAGIELKSYILQDFHTGRVLAGQNPDLRVDPASLTKIMTTYVVLQTLAAGKLQLNDQVTVSEKAWRTGGSKMFIKVDSQVEVATLLRGVIIQSGNDACIALAEHIAGSEAAFVALMNQQALRLGMHNTHYANSDGLPDPELYSSARDLAILAAALIRDFPEHYKIHAEREFVYNGIKQQNRNTLLGKDPSVDGVKTGHTEAAGYCLVASAQRNGSRLVSAVLGAKSVKLRETYSQTLLNYGFRNYAAYTLYQPGTALVTRPVWYGATPTVTLGVQQPLVATLTAQEYGQLSATVELDARLTAPLAQGAVVGLAQVYLSGKPLVQAPLITLQPVAAGSTWQQMRDGVAAWLE
jgi:D-alanyl-D-alanine carboxypeptidase (penicillin-binding protein 5/6)